MQEKDVVSVEYFEEPERFADLLNGYLFDGKQVVKPENVRERNRVIMRTRRDGRQLEGGFVIRDVMQEVGFGMQVVLVSLEEQSDIHYAMPVRVMNADAMVYQRQWKKRRKKHWEKKDLKGAEFLSGFSKADKLIPTLTLVLYWGAEVWDGPRSLKDMMDLSGIPAHLKNRVADYPMELLEVRNFSDTKRFRTDVRQVFEFLKYAADKKKLAEYVATNQDVFSKLDEQAYDLISCMSKSSELKAIKKKCQDKKGGKINMCKAITDMIADGRKEGKREGRREGKREGELLFARLTQILLKDGKVEILSRAADDEGYRKELYRRYGIER